MRTEQHLLSGPVDARIAADVITVYADPKTTAARAVLMPLVDDDEIARERIANADIASGGAQFTVSLPAKPTSVAHTHGTTIASNGAVIQSGSAEQVNIVHGGGTIITGNAVATSGHGITHTAPGAVEVMLYTPTGSNLVAKAGDITAHGELATVDATTTSGDIRLDRITDELRSKASSGNIAVSVAEGTVALTTSSGNIAAHELHRGGVLRASSGNVQACLDGPAELRAEVSSGNLFLKTAGAATEGCLSWRVSSGKVSVNGQPCPNRG